MKKLFIALTLLLILSGCARPNSLPTKKIVMNGQSVLVEVAQTPEARNQGLSGRSSLCSNCGMLFTFGQLDQYTFWMKDMNFALDLVWLKDGVIEEITSNLPAPKPGEDPSQVQVGKPVNQVIEIKAGQAAAWGLEIGQKVGALEP